MKLGNLNFEPVEDSWDMVGEPVRDSIQANQLQDVLVAEIDSGLSDTAAFCEEYGIGPEVSVNCVIVEAKRAGRTWYAACLVPATMRADINGIVRRELNARKISFAPMEQATSLTKMEYGGISPIGLPADWPVLVETSIQDISHAVIGSGIRKSKLLIPSSLLASLPNANTVPLTKNLS